MKTNENKQKEKKCYVIIISEQFPHYHLNAGVDTNFERQIKDNLKIHTLRENVEFWKRRCNKINAGEAYLSIRKWSGKPYNSTQIELFKFEKVGFELIRYSDSTEIVFINEKPTNTPLEEIAINDGLTLDDFKRWFNGYPRNELACIHLTDFRYENIL